MIASDFKERSSFAFHQRFSLWKLIEFFAQEAFLTDKKPTDIEVAVVGDNVPFHSMGTTDIEDILQTIAERE